MHVRWAVRCFYDHDQKNCDLLALLFCCPWSGLRHHARHDDSKANATGCVSKWERLITIDEIKIEEHAWDGQLVSLLSVTSTSGSIAL